MDENFYKKKIEQLEEELAICMEEKEKLEEEVKWMHDTIWKLLRRLKQ